MKPNAGAVRYELSDVVRMLTESAGEGVDHDEVVDQALALLAEQRAEDERPLCPGCGRRRVNRGRDLCGPCEDTADRQREHKLKWWNEKGADRRAQAREAQQASGAIRVT